MIQSFLSPELRALADALDGHARECDVQLILKAAEELDRLRPIVDDLAMIVRRFCHHTKLNRECQAQAMDYLCRKELQGSILR